MNLVTIVFQGTLSTSAFEDATCAALKNQEEELGIDIVSCCTSAERADDGGRRLQLGNGNTTAIIEFTTNVVHTVDSATSISDDVWQVAFADAINSAAFGNMIGGTVIDFEAVSMKTSKSGTSGGSMRSPKSGSGSSGSIKSSKSSSASGGSTKSMKSSASSGGSSF